MKLKCFHYADAEGVVIQIRAKRKPSEKTRTRNGTWVVREFNRGKWEIPSFPEVTWGTLKYLEFLGSVDYVATNK